MLPLKCGSLDLLNLRMFSWLILPFNYFFNDVPELVQPGIMACYKGKGY